jgi:hypothetical protein
LCQNDVQIFGDGTFQYCAIVFWSVIYTSCLPKRTVYTMCVFPHSTQKQRMLYWNVSVSLGCLYSGWTNLPSDLNGERICMWIKIRYVPCMLNYLIIEHVFIIHVYILKVVYKCSGNEF